MNTRTDMQRLRDAATIIERQDRELEELRGELAKERELHLATRKERRKLAGQNTKLQAENARLRSVQKRALARLNATDDEYSNLADEAAEILEGVTAIPDDACSDDPDGQHHVGCGCES